jgi:surfeit locus 1 family protein
MGLRAAVVAAVLLLLGLGVWQLERRLWKLALIDRVELRLAAAPVAAPGPSRWSGIDRDAAYTRIAARGRFLPVPPTYAQAVTGLGGGFWVIAPLRTGEGWTVFVNRGFVPKRGVEAPPPAKPVVVTGLLRLTEPGGGFLRRNDPAAGRWYSRDLAAIAAGQRLGAVAPYFIDADRQGSGWPRGGMTVVRFNNNHLVYALTWFGLAGLIATMAWRAGRSAR